MTSCFLGSLFPILENVPGKGESDNWKDRAELTFILQGHNNSGCQDCLLFEEVRERTKIWWSQVALQTTLLRLHFGNPSKDIFLGEEQNMLLYAISIDFILEQLVLSV